MLEALTEECVYNEGSATGQKTNMGFENWGWWSYPLRLILLGESEQVTRLSWILTSLLCLVVAIKPALPTSQAVRKNKTDNIL